MSPMVETITVSILVFVKIASSLLAKFSNIMMAFAPDVCIGEAFHQPCSGFVLMITNPAFNAANITMGYCNKFGICSAILSPF